MGGNLCSCASGNAKLGKAASQDNLYTISRKNGPYPRTNHSGGLFAPPSTDPLMTSSPCSTPKSLVLNHPLGQGSQTTLTESGISSKASTSFEESTLEGTVTPTTVHSLSAPSTPVMIPRKPPPKPPRMRSYLESTGSYDRTLSPSPSVRSRASLKSSLADVTSSLDVMASPEGSMILKPGPQLVKDKVCHILLETRDFLIYEINPDNILGYLLHKGVISSRNVEELQQATTKFAKCEMLLEIITSKGHKEFLTLCDALRTVGRQQYLADLLLVLDSLIETVAVTNGTENEPIIKDNNGSSGYVSELDSSRSKIDCNVCSCNNNNDDLDGVLNDPASFDFDIAYYDTETGNMKSTKDIATIKKKKRQRLSDSDDSFVLQSSFNNTDRYLPVISVSLYNQCLCNEGMETLSRILEKYSCIRELSLAKNHVGLPAICRLGQALQKNRGLVKLDIRLNTIGDEGARHLAEGLQRTYSLRVLNMTSTGLSGPGCNLIVQGLSRNKCLNELDVSFNDLQDVGCEAIAEVLKGNSSLRKLRMRDNNVTCKGARLLFKVLKKNARLSELDMSSNAIGDSVNMLSEVLLCNRALREINLENCRISKTGCVALARALKTNTSLKQLDLSMNPIRDEGVEALSDGLKYNQVLDVLCLNMCNIGNRGFLKLLDALRFNAAMATLKLCYNNIGQTDGVMETEDEYAPLIAPIEELYEKLCQILQLNKTLKVLLWGNKLEEPEVRPCTESTV